MKKLIYLLPVLLLIALSCEDKVEDPVITEFSATPTTVNRTDTVTFTIDATADFVILFDGKTIIDLSGADMPYTHQKSKIVSTVTPPADTVWAKLVVRNVYDTDNMKTVTDSIQIIILP